VGGDEPGRRPAAGAAVPGAWAQAVVTLALFFGGAPVGTAAARVVAPGSDVAQVVAFLALPLALITGLERWLGAAIVMLLPRFIAAIRRREWRPDMATRAVDLHAVPPGHAAFVATGTLWGGVAGLVVGLVPSAPSFAGAAGTFAALGLCYGLLARALARRGLLPFPAEG
jgi:hypothetical protein